MSSYWFSPTESNFYRATLHTAVYATARCSTVRHKLRCSVEWLNGSSTKAIRSRYPALCCKGIGVSPKNKGTSQSSLWKSVPNSELSRCFWFVAMIRPPSQVLSTSFDHRKLIIFCRPPFFTAIWPWLRALRAVRLRQLRLNCDIDWWRLSVNEYGMANDPKSCH